jgi:hypothetical protein
MYLLLFVFRVSTHINLMVNNQGAGAAQVVRWPGYGLDDSFQQISISPRHTLSLLCILFEWCQELFSWGWSGSGSKLTTHLQSMPKLRIRTSIPPLPHVTAARCCTDHPPPPPNRAPAIPLTFKQHTCSEAIKVNYTASAFSHASTINLCRWSSKCPTIRTPHNMAGIVERPNRRQDR